MDAKSFNLSAQGASHIKKNKECQDASSSFYDEKMAIAIVCDGHGGDDYMRSAVGSTLAAATTEKNIKSFLNKITKEQFFANPEKALKTLEASIINGWNEAIKMHFDTHPFTEAELSGISEKARRRYTQEGRIESAYGTTVIAVAMTHEFWIGLHIGDGKCVAVNPEGKFVQPIPWDPKCFLNATTSICDSDALDRFRHFYSEKLPAAVFVGSDGIDDCFSNNDQLHNLYKTILYSFATTDFDEAVDGLKDYLPRLSAKGSGDDVSIAAMFDLDLIPELEVVKDFDREKEKARVEENARKEAERNEAEKRRVEQEHAKFQSQNNRSARQNVPQGSKKIKFCTECGAELRPGMKFCSECGAMVAIIPKPNGEMTKSDDVHIINVNPVDVGIKSENESSEENNTMEVDDVAPNTEENNTTADSVELEESVTTDVSESNTDESMTDVTENATEDVTIAAEELEDDSVNESNDIITEDVNNASSDETVTEQ